MKKSVFFFLLLFLAGTINAQEENIIQGDIILKLEKNTSIESFCRSFKETVNNEISFTPERCLSQSVNLWLVKYDPTDKDQNAILDQVRRHKNILVAQHNHTNVNLRTTTPDDTQYGSQWAHENTGQSGGTPGADMDTPEAWDISTGGTTTQGDDIVVAIVDGGFDIGHEDLVPNIWVNVDEIAGNGIDDDGNGYIDDINGWDAFGNDGGLPVDNHGTHVAGISGAKGNNAQGVSGINWDVKLMLVAGSSGNEATVVAAYGYILDERTAYNDTDGAEGSFVVSTNASFGVDFGDPDNFPLWCGMYDDLGMQGIISCGATANANTDVDAQGDVPTACPSDYLISVTNTTNTDAKNNGAAFGLTTIDLGAPGTGILSTTTGSNYGNLTGTSMATPQVAGTVGLLVAAACDDFITDYKADPATYALDLKDAILNGVDPIAALNGITVTGGRLNVYNAILELNPGTDGECAADFTLSANQETVEICSPDNAVYTIDVGATLNFMDPVTLSVTGLPAGTTAGFSSNPVTPGSSTTLTISNTGSAASGTYALEVTGTSTTTPKTLDLNLDIRDVAPGSINLLTPMDGATNVSTQTNLTLTWETDMDATAYNFEIATDPAFSSIVESSSNAGGSFTLTSNLSANTTYFWRVTPTNICGSGTTSSTFSFDSQDVVYCDASGDDASEEWIESIEVAGVSNVSGTDDGYGDFSSITIDVDVNETYDFTLTPEWEATLYDEYWMIWIDYNNNGDFTDAGENVFDQGGADQNTQTGSFTIPATATLGNVRMRIAMRFDNQPDPCGSFNFGEVEDYTINISDPSCATNVIETGTYAAGTVAVIESGDIIESDATLQDGSDITYDAEVSIELLPDFETILGAEFEAIIEGCGGATTVQNEEIEGSDK